MYTVYILQCGDKSLYTGITTEMARRFKEHEAGTASHYTSARKVTAILYTESVPDRSAALKRESEIKRWPRRKKLRLVAETNLNN